MKSILLLSLLVFASGACAETLFTVPWGKGAGQVGYHNKSTPPFDQPYAEGPGGIAVGPGGEIWISDQFNDRLLRFDRSGKLLGAVDKLGDHRVIAPRALWIDPGKALAVLLAQDMAVLCQDEAAKKVERLEKVEGKAMPQVEAVQGGPGGELWLGDFGMSALIRWDPKSGATQKRRWGLGGLAVDAQGSVYTLEYRAGSGGAGEHYVVSTDVKGHAKDHFPLVAPELQAPYLCGLDSAGNVYVRFIKTLDAKSAAGQNPNRFLIVKYDAEGKAGKPLGETLVSVVSQQFCVTPEGAVIGLSFDAMAAPQGHVEVVELK